MTYITFDISTYLEFPNTASVNKLQHLVQIMMSSGCKQNSTCCGSHNEQLHKFWFAGNIVYTHQMMCVVYHIIIQSSSLPDLFNMSLILQSFLDLSAKINCKNSNIKINTFTFRQCHRL